MRHESAEWRRRGASGRERRPAGTRVVVLVATLAAAAVASAPGDALAQSHASSIPSGKIGVVVAGRQNVGALASSYGLGVVWGVSAGYQPTSMARPWSVGVDWSVLWGRFAAADSAVSIETLHTLEMSFGGRFRWLVDDEAPRFFTATAGVTLYRTNIPVPPDNTRVHVGPYAGLGAEAYLGSYLIGFEARYGLLTAGPGSLSLLLSLSWGD